jgi:hypothetical protein
MLECFLVKLQQGCEECVESAAQGLSLFSDVLQECHTHIAAVGGTDAHSDALLSAMKDLHWNVTAVSIQHETLQLTDEIIADTPPGEANGSLFQEDFKCTQTSKVSK